MFLSPADPVLTRRFIQSRSSSNRRLFSLPNQSGRMSSLQTRPQRKKTCNCDADYFSSASLRHRIAPKLRSDFFRAANEIEISRRPHRTRRQSGPRRAFVLSLRICLGGAGDGRGKAELDSVVAPGSALPERPHRGPCSIGSARFRVASPRSGSISSIRFSCRPPH